MRSHTRLLAAISLVLGAALSQTSPAGAQEQVIRIEVTANDYAAGAGAHRQVHTAGALRPEGGRYSSKTFETDSSGALVEVTGRLRSSIQSIAAATPPAATGEPPFAGPGFYPADLSLLTTTGQVITQTQFYNIYVNCDPNCWSNPAVFENRLLSSSFIHVVDQYAGTDDERYRLGPSTPVRYAITKTLVTAPLMDDNDIAAILHAAAVKFGTGYNHVYNIFLPKGVDNCFGFAPPYATCFSPDSNAQWTFCAWHGWFNGFPDLAGSVYLTVEPYPDVFSTDSNGVPFYGCDVGQGPSNFTTNTNPTPNGVLIDSLSSWLDHEFFETITDPDITEWQVLNDLDLYGREIGDVCQNFSFDFTPFSISGHFYEVQPVYSNRYHACVTVP